MDSHSRQQSVYEVKTAARTTKMLKIVPAFAEGSNNLADHTAANRNRTWAFGLKFVNNVLAGTQIADAAGDRSNGANGMPAALQREMQAFGSRL